MSIKKSIGWTDMTCNPIRGMCQGGCWYCWTKGFYRRKFLETPTRLHLSAFLKLPKRESKKVFLCSTHDLFGSWIPKRWRDDIFEQIEMRYKHTFQILTKFPENVDRSMPNNVWLGVTVTGSSPMAERERLDIFQEKKAKIKFISYEPILREVGFEEKDKINWLILGALTGHSYKNRYRPHVVYLQRIIEGYRKNGTKVFLKNNLTKIWRGPLIQEWPEEE